MPYSSTGNYKPQYCGTGVSSVPYNFVNVTSGAGQNLAMETTGTDAGEYEIIPFNDVYKTSDTSGLAVSSALAEAVGASGSGCTGLSAPGGQGTYYAQVIYAAQAAAGDATDCEPDLKERDDHSERRRCDRM